MYIFFFLLVYITNVFGEYLQNYQVKYQEEYGTTALIARVEVATLDGVLVLIPTLFLLPSFF